MQENKIIVDYKVYDSLHELLDADKILLEKAVSAAQLAYAPYSKFQVGAAIALQNGVVVAGSNQENASFPVGICAERVALGNLAMQFPDEIILTIAIYANNKPEKAPAAPCGMCRQALFEKEQLQKQPIRILLKGNGASIIELKSVADVLPLGFML